MCHLVTAAEGAESAYTTSNNAVRKETAEEARILDKNTLNCWLGHPSLMIASNDGTKDFQDKLRLVTDFVLREVQRKLVHTGSA